MNINKRLGFIRTNKRGKVNNTKLDENRVNNAAYIYELPLVFRRTSRYSSDHIKTILSENIYK